MRRYTISINETAYTIDVEEVSSDRFSVHLEDGRLVDATLVEHRDLSQARISPSVELGEPRPGPDVAAVRSVRPSETAAASRPASRRAVRGALTAPMPGMVLSIEVAPGETVSRGQTVLVLEAMKMKNTLHAEADGVVARIAVAVGDQVRHGDVLVEFEG